MFYNENTHQHGHIKQHTQPVQLRTRPCRNNTDDQDVKEKNSCDDVRPETGCPNTFNKRIRLVYILTFFLGTCLWWFFCYETRLNLPKPWFHDPPDFPSVKDIHSVVAMHMCSQRIPPNTLREAIRVLQVYFPWDPAFIPQPPLLVEKLLTHPQCNDPSLFQHLQNHCSHVKFLHPRSLEHLLESIHQCFIRLQNSSVAASPYMIVVDWNHLSLPNATRSLYVAKSVIAYMNGPQITPSGNTSSWLLPQVLAQIWFQRHPNEEKTLEDFIHRRIHFCFTLFSEHHGRILTWDFQKEIQHKRLKDLFMALRRFLDLELFSLVIQNIPINDVVRTHVEEETSKGNSGSSSSSHKLVLSQHVWNLFQRVIRDQVTTCSVKTKTYSFGLFIPPVSPSSMDPQTPRPWKISSQGKGFSHPHLGTLVFVPFSPPHHAFETYLSESQHNFTSPTLHQLDTATAYWVAYIRMLLGLPQRTVLSPFLIQHYRCEEQHRSDAFLDHQNIQCLTWLNTTFDVRAEIPTKNGLAEWELRSIERKTLQFSIQSTIQQIQKVYILYRRATFRVAPTFVVSAMKKALDALDRAVHVQDSYSRRLKWVHLADDQVTKSLQQGIAMSSLPNPLSHQVAIYAPVLIPVTITWFILLVTSPPWHLGPLLHRFNTYWSKTTQHSNIEKHTA